MPRYRSSLQRLSVLAEATSTPVLGFVMIPVLMAATGSVGLGHFVFVQAICASVSVIGMGLSLAAINSVARHAAVGGDHQAVDARAALVVAGMASALIVLCAMSPLTGLVSRSGAVPDEVIRLGLIWAALQLPGPILLALLKGRERFIEAALVELCAKALVYGTFVVALVSFDRFPLVSALRAAIVAEGVAIAWRWAVASRLVGGTVLPVPRESTPYRSLFRFSRGVWLQAGSSLAFNTLDKFVVGVIAGPAVLGAYAATAQIASLVHFVPSAVASVHVPRVAAAQSTATGLVAVRAALSREVRLMTALLALCALVLMAASQYTSLWPVLEIPGQSGPLVSLLIAYGILALAIVDYTMLLGTSRTSVIGTVNLAASVVACALLVAGSLGASLLVVALGRVGYAVVCAAGLRFQARRVQPEAVRT